MLNKVNTLNKYLKTYNLTFSDVVKRQKNQDTQVTKSQKRVRMCHFGVT